MGSFLEKYSGSEWDDVANEVIDVLEIFERLLKKEKYEPESQREKIRLSILKRIKKLKKDFVE